MGVDEVVPAFGSAGLDPHDSRSHGAKLAGEILLDQAFERSGGDVPDENPGCQLDRWRQRGGRAAREDLDLGSGLGQPLGGFNDVDVHAPGVTGARLIQR